MRVPSAGTGGPGLRRLGARRADPQLCGAASTSPSASAPTATGCRASCCIAKSTYVWLDQLSQRLRPRDHAGSTRSPTRSSTALARRGFTGLWLIGLWERSQASQRDQAAARQPRGRRLGLLAATTTTSPTTSAARRRYAEPARPRLAARHPPGQRHGAQPHGHRLALGDRASRLVHVAAGHARSRPTRSTARTCPTTAASASTSRTTTSTAPTPRWCSSASTAGPATRATSTTATTAPACRGTTPPSSTTSSAEVREAVIQTILHVARQFPIIRFDAAMTLAKRHYPAAVVPRAGQRRRDPVARRARR